MIELSTSLRMFQWIGALRSFLDLHEDNADDVHEIVLQVYSEIFQFMFEINDDIVRNSVIRVVNIELEKIRNIQRYNLQDYYVMCNSINNTPKTIDIHKLVVGLAIRLKNSKEIYFNIEL